ncbi:MAG: PDZ domain-containing protein [Deltaproteobacteria bacterium]|nr:PDZ domain-containing protein [Deltaproteobacteria bacterium]
MTARIGLIARFGILSALLAVFLVTPPCPAGDGNDQPRPFLGIGYRPATELESRYPGLGLTQGLRVARVVGGSAAMKAGIRVGDVIIACDSMEIGDLDPGTLLQSFSSYIKDEKKVGDDLRLRIVREETTIEEGRSARPQVVKDRKELDALIDVQKPGKSLDVSVRKEVHILDITAVLEARKNQARVSPEEWKDYADRYGGHPDPLATFIHSLIAHYDLEDAYEDLLSRYREDEEWSDPFRTVLFRYIHENPLQLPLVADDITRQLEQAPIENMVLRATELLGRPAGPFPPIPAAPETEDPAEHISYIRNLVDAAVAVRERALKDIAPGERRFLAENLPKLIEDGFDCPPETNDCVSVSETGERALMLLEKIDTTALVQAGAILSRLADGKWIDRFGRAMEAFDAPGEYRVDGISGDILYREETAAGAMIILGSGPNRVSADIPVIIDLGGDDTYLSPSKSGTDGPAVVLILDCCGNDLYTATRDFSQGGALLGISMVIDESGDDTYRSTRFSQGTGVAGTGILIDLAGDDRYEGQEYNQGVGFWGIGLLIDHGGDDGYFSHLYAQGVGGPGGTGILRDEAGDDRYSATGKKPGSYGISGVFDGFSQGFGVGFRDRASGGIGILIDGDGRDRFVAGNFSQGGGYYFGLGILMNGGDQDDTYSGSRYGQGFSAHSAAGILIDEGGNDHYSGLVGALQGAAWDLGSAALIDRAGDDVYDCRDLFFSQGAAAHNGFSVFLDMNGRDTYYLTNNRDIRNDYHGGPSMAFFIDNGGLPDKYTGTGGTSANNRVVLEGEYGVFVDLDGDLTRKPGIQDLEERSNN